MSNQRRRSRPSSATSRSSVSENEIRLECRAVFLGRYDDIKEEIESKDDLIQLLQQTGRNSSSRTISKYWTKNTDSLQFDDFVDICRREPVTSEDELMKAFRKIDINGDGYISLEELFRVMTTKGEKMSKSEVKAMIDEVDENKDGKLNYREFAHMVVSSAEDFKRISIKVMEKKERRKLKKPDGDVTPRRDKDGHSMGSQLSIRSASSEKNEVSQSRRGSRPKSAGRSGRNEPNNLQDWSSAHTKGTFFLDEDSSILSHAFSLSLSEDTDVYITIQPLKIGESGESLDGTITDTALLVLNNDNSYVAFTDNRDNKGKYSLRCSLSMGNYTLIPFTTGCRLRPRRDMAIKEAKLVTKDKEGKIVLTRSFRKALEEIFEMADLDGNGLLSRDEFNWYNQRTSGEEIADDEWQVVEDNIDLDRGEITRSGFIKLNDMEAEDNEGDTEDLWITLTSMGFNKGLILDEACPFLIKVHTQDGSDPDLIVTAMENNTKKINNAICEFVFAKGDGSRVKGMKDLTMYTYQNDHRAIIVVDNKSKSRVKVKLDCSQRKGLVSHTGSLIADVIVPAQNAVIGHHILPLDERGEFNVVCEESILK